MSDWPPFEDLYPKSEAYLDLQPLRIPAGWSIGWNQLDVSMRTDINAMGGTCVFHATNEGRRFNIDVERRPESDPDGAVYMTVTYQPWPRNERGRRLKDVPFHFGVDREIVHEFETRSYADLLAELEHWIARCTVWTREGH